VATAIFFGAGQRAPELKIVIDALHHVNVVTSRLEEMTSFYVEVLGLEAGARPPFRSTGAWLYAAGAPVVHLVRGAPSPRGVLPQIEHFAFASRGLGAVEARLRECDVWFETGAIPGLGWPIVNLADPDGNRIEIVFPNESPQG
jgi:catechol 2,3-dioxygenase-like lactoylglutathione lyase family enzyme